MKALFDPLVLRKITLASAADLSRTGGDGRKRKSARQEKVAMERIRPRPTRGEAVRGARLMLPAEAQAVIRKPEKNGRRGAEDRR